MAFVSRFGAMVKIVELSTQDHGSPPDEVLPAGQGRASEPAHRHDGGPPGLERNVNHSSNGDEYNETVNRKADLKDLCNHGNLSALNKPQNATNASK